MVEMTGLEVVGLIAGLVGIAFVFSAGVCWVLIKIGEFEEEAAEFLEGRDDTP